VSIKKKQIPAPANCPERADCGTRRCTWLQAGCLLLAVIWTAALQAEEDVPKAIFLVTEPDRVIAANADTGQFFELELHAKETVEYSQTASAAAVLVTNQRFVAIGAFPGGWRSIRRQADEDLIRAEAEGYSVLVVTSDRILSFSGRNGSWSFRGH
jgi:hypothetical protein